jgi:hypothetical protein
MLKCRKVLNLPSQREDLKILPLLSVFILITIATCGQSNSEKGNARLLAEFELESTPVFDLAISPDDRYVAILTWRNYANTLSDQGVTSLRVQVVSVEGGSIIQTLELPDIPGQLVSMDEMKLNWKDLISLRICVPDTCYSVNSETGSFVVEGGAVLFPPHAEDRSGKCYWSPQRTYCAFVENGMLHVQGTTGHSVWGRRLCDSSYPSCDKYPLIWTSVGDLVFVSEEKGSVASLYLWTR